MAESRTTMNQYDAVSNKIARFLCKKLSLDFPNTSATSPLQLHMNIEVYIKFKDYLP